MRVDEQTDAFLHEQAKRREFSSISGYVKWLITQDRKGESPAVLSLEKSMAKSMGNLDSEIAGLRANLAATEAFLHVFVKMFLVSIPETTGEGRKALEANAKRRYERLLQQAALEINQPEPEAE